MSSVAAPQDLLLAYDADFTGYTSLSRMAQPLEDRAAIPRSRQTGTLGGTADPDGYYEDFTARLGRFVREYPMLGAFEAPPGNAKVAPPPVAVSFGGIGDSDSDDFDDAGADDDGADDDGFDDDGADDDGADGADGADDVGADGGADGGADAGAGRRQSSMPNLRDFVVNVRPPHANGPPPWEASRWAPEDLLGGDSDGEMNETDAEMCTYETIHIQPPAGGDAVSPQESILSFRIKK